MRLLSVSVGSVEQGWRRQSQLVQRVGLSRLPNTLSNETSYSQTRLFPIGYPLAIVIMIETFVPYGEKMGKNTENEAYCPTCDTEQGIQTTVPWQPDLCTVCGTDID